MRDVAVHTTEELSIYKQLLVTEIGNIISNFTNFVERQCNIVVNSVIHHALFVMQQKFDNIADGKTEDVNLVDMQSYNDVVSAIDVLDTVSNNVVQSEIQAAIDGKILGFVPQLRNEKLNSMELNDLINLRLLYSRIYSESFEFTPMAKRLRDYRNGLDTFVIDKENALDVPRGKELVDKLGIKMDVFDKSKEDAMCHKRFMTAVLSGEYNLKELVESHRIEREKYEQEMQKRMDERKDQPAEQPEPVQPSE
jgi:hypothetical protein